MTDVSLFRLYLMRAGYLFWALALGSDIWPDLINHPASWPLPNSVTASLLGALAALALLGVRYPLQMLPLLLFELLWKAIWLIAVALPLWLSGELDAARSESAFACIMGVVIVPIVVPWPYVYAHYVKKSGNPWRHAAAFPAPGRAGR
jgi:hypothetical protein